MSHRIREAMRSGDLAPMGGNGGIVEADETFIGNDPARPKKKGARAFHHKMKVLSLVDRATGQVRSAVMDELSLKTILPILRDNIARESHLMTDESFIYATAGRFFSDHGTVQHQKGEYGRGVIHTNTIEGFFSIFKRGMRGVYQHCAKKHLHRYMAEFDFRYSNRKAVGIDDAQRADLALMGIRGKRLTYQTIGV